jgi:hypothetical protein
MSKHVVPKHRQQVIANPVAESTDDQFADAQ